MNHRSSAYLLVVLAIGIRSTLTPIMAGPLQRDNTSTICRDEVDLRYGDGSLRRVGSQVQECSAGKWIAGSGEANKPAVHPKGAVCKTERGQSYETGLVRAVGEGLQRCDDGTWTSLSAAAQRLPAKEVPQLSKPCQLATGKPVPTGTQRTVDSKTQECVNGKWVVKRNSKRE